VGAILERDEGADNADSAIGSYEGAPIIAFGNFIGQPGWPQIFRIASTYRSAFARVRGPMPNPPGDDHCAARSTRS